LLFKFALNNVLNKDLIKRTFYTW